ncbi:MAG: hypothetical protein AABY75_05545 [Bacteroidota bacterium]
MKTTPNERRSAVGVLTHKGTRYEIREVWVSKTGRIEWYVCKRHDLHIPGLPVGSYEIDLTPEEVSDVSIAIEKGQHLKAGDCERCGMWRTEVGPCCPPK